MAADLVMKSQGCRCIRKARLSLPRDAAPAKSDIYSWPVKMKVLPWRRYAEVDGSMSMREERGRGCSSGESESSRLVRGGKVRRTEREGVRTGP